MTSVPNELSESVSKLVELTKQLSEAKSDIKVLNQEEKRLKESVKKHMVDQGIDTINLRKGRSVFVKVCERLVSIRML